MSTPRKEQVPRSSQYGRLALALALTLAGCGRPNPADRPLRPQEVKDFGTLYTHHCAGCHGVDGRLGPAPPLNDPLFLAIVPDAELQRVITRGRPGTLMPAFGDEDGGDLTAAQVDILIAGMRARWDNLPQQERNGLPPYRVEQTSADKDNGAMVFQMSCASCHGDHGQGGKDAGAVHDPAFLALISDQALRRLVITGRPDFGMPNYRERGDDRPREFQPLSVQDITDVTALLASWRTSPASSPHDNMAATKKR